METILSCPSRCLTRSLLALCSASLNEGAPVPAPAGFQSPAAPGSAPHSSYLLRSSTTHRKAHPVPGPMASNASVAQLSHPLQVSLVLKI